MYLALSCGTKISVSFMSLRKREELKEFWLESFPHGPSCALSSSTANVGHRGKAERSGGLWGLWAVGWETRMALSVLSGPVPLGGFCLHFTSHSLPQVTGISLGNLGFALAVLVFLAVTGGCRLFLGWFDGYMDNFPNPALYPVCVDGCFPGEFRSSAWQWEWSSHGQHWWPLIPCRAVTAAQTVPAPVLTQIPFGCH